MNWIDLLDQGTRQPAEYAGGLSNHFPMAVLALRRLGADDVRLQAFAVSYATRLGVWSPDDAAQTWHAGDPWASRLGEPGALGAYRHLFAQWLDSEDAGEVLAQVLPTLMRGCGAAAFHGLIRTAYAVEAAHRAELPVALAYWASRWLALGPAGMLSAVTQRPLQTDPAAVLRSLPVVRGAARGSLIVDRLQQAARQRGFAAAVAGLAITADTLPQLALGAADLYARSDDFTFLHLMTSAHAMRLLLRYTEEPLPAVAAYWQAFAAAWAGSGARPAAVEQPRLRPWPELVALAIASDDEHCIKAVDTCRQQQAARPAHRGHAHPPRP